MSRMRTSGAIVSYYTHGKCWMPETYHTEAERAASVQAREEADKRLREFHDQGVPFFNKEHIRHVLDQLDHYRANPRQSGDTSPRIISIPALDGSMIECELETGASEPGWDSDRLSTELELVADNPHLDYRTFHQMVHPDSFGYSALRMAYCSTYLTYPQRMRQISTNEFLPPWRLAPVDDVQRKFDAGITAWEEDEDCKRLRSSLSTIPLPKVTKIVAFACSTMSVYDAPRSDPVCQHALILTLRDVLNRRRSAGQPELKCFAQDPTYREADVEVLRKAGITVLDDPRGFLEVDDETVVLSFYPNIPVRQIIADIARPAILMWNHVQSEDEALASFNKFHPDQEANLEATYHGFTDPNSPRLRDMVREHYESPIRFRSEGRFEDASLYIRLQESHVGDAKKMENEEDALGHTNLVPNL